MHTGTPWWPSLESSSQNEGEVHDSVRAMDAALKKLGAPRDVIDLSRLTRVGAPARQSGYDESEARRARRAYLKLQLASCSSPSPEETVNYLENSKLWRRPDIELPCLEDWAFIEEVDQRKHRLAHNQISLPPPALPAKDCVGGLRPARPTAIDEVYEQRAARSHRKPSAPRTPATLLRWKKKNDFAAMFFDPSGTAALRNESSAKNFAEPSAYPDF